MLLLHRIVNVVPLSKLQTTSFLHAPYIVHQKEYKVCWSWMMIPDAGLKSMPSTSKPSEENAQPHDDDDRFAVLKSGYQRAGRPFFALHWFALTKLRRKSGHCFCPPPLWKCFRYRWLGVRNKSHNGTDR